MASHEHDSDIIQWGLRLLDGDPVYNSSYYYGDMIQHNANDIYHEEYFRSHYDTESNHVENDEIIARTLQEEFSGLSVTEASEYPHAGEAQAQASVLADEWHGVSTRNYCSDHDYGQEEASSLCSSPGNHLELTDECALDGEVDWSLNPVPHIPRINGEIPSFDEATSDHQRLLDRLQIFGFLECKVEGDGNCQFHALSDQLYHTPDHHKYVRSQVVNQLKSHPEIYEGYVPMAYDDYLEKMSTY
ncbi:PREDICTED: OTU [Prunus dulcis]|uniref:PREDICTED: OTU n=1 Tax=Prunus dulcis TaxID=3755 RepID=A0A5E4ERU1_PRUDU|nr:PREDICTED: OTU [Prunus dulcis]